MQTNILPTSVYSKYGLDSLVHPRLSISFKFCQASRPVKPSERKNPSWHSCAV